MGRAGGWRPRVTFIGIIILVLLGLWNIAPAESMPTEGLTSHLDCSLDDDVTNPQLTQCLQRGRRFVGRYLRHLAHDENEAFRRPFDKCSAFILFHDCLQPLLDNCANLRDRVLAEWGPILDVLRCACSGGHECVEHLQCFEEEFRGTMVRNCDKHFHLDVQQRTQSRCHFLGESIHCKMRLVSSGCGHHMGQFAFTLNKLAQLHLLDKEDCYVPRHDHYAGGLTYTDTCSREVRNNLQQCRVDYLAPETLLVFREDDNDLIANGGRKTVEKACMDFMLYQQCTKSYRDQCAPMVEELLRFDERHRIYLAKMEVICAQPNAVYGHHVRCFRQASRDGLLRPCDKQFPDLNRTSAYKFYCEPENHQSHKMQRELDSIRSCYKGEFAAGCGNEAADIMDKLIQKAFQDPSYLLLDYRPRCWAHKPPHHPASGDDVTKSAPHKTGPTTRRLRPRERAVPPHPPVLDVTLDEMDRPGKRPTPRAESLPRTHLAHGGHNGSVTQTQLSVYLIFLCTALTVLISR